MYKKWSQEEIEKLIKNYPILDSENLETLFQRSKISIEKMRKKLRLKKNKYWSATDIEKLRQLYPITRYEKLEEIFGKPIHQINQKASKLKLKKDNAIYDGWSATDIEKLRQLYPITRYEKLEEIFGRKTQYIKIKANNLGIFKSKNLYKNSSGEFLTDNSIESYYWLGFILADGHIENHRLTIGLSIKDKLHLQKLAHKLNCNLKYYNSNTAFGNFNKCVLAIKDVIHIKNFQEKFNITNNKTYNPPIISTYNLLDNQYIALIIGFIDGDGCIQTLKRNNKQYSITIKIHSSWLENLEFMKNYLIKYTGINSKMLIKIDKHGYLRLSITHQQIIFSLMDFINDNNLPILERKWNKII